MTGFEQSNIFRKFSLIAKTACDEAVFKNGALLLCEYRTENYDEYGQLGYKLEILVKFI